MRYEKLALLLRMARLLAGNSEGMTLDEIAAEAGVDRRTAERMRDALRDLFPTMEELREGRAKRFRIRGGLDGFLQAPTADELAELEAATRGLEGGGGEARAVLLRSLAAKIRAALRPAVRQRIDPDLEALVQTEAFVLQAGPRPLADAATLGRLRECMKAGRVCAMDYPTAEGRTRRRAVEPYGILFGKAYYLVGPEAGKPEPVLWRLDRMRKVEIGEAAAGPPADFALAEFAARSFGAYQEEPADIALRFAPEAAADARRFLFHPAQTVEDLADGSLAVRFRSGGLLELARHLFTWGDTVEIIAPPRLRELMVGELEAALARHRG
jgi:predicted DNA-binding transcriptional regulator YafY